MRPLKSSDGSAMLKGLANEEGIMDILANMFSVSPTTNSSCNEFVNMGFLSGETCQRAQVRQMAYLHHCSNKPLARTNVLGCVCWKSRHSQLLELLMLCIIRQWRVTHSYNVLPVLNDSKRASLTHPTGCKYVSMPQVL